MKNSRLSLMLVGASLLAPAAASAQYSPTPVVVEPTPVASGTGVQEHDGFYLRLTLGGGYTQMKASYQGDSMTFKGGAGALGLAVGGAVSPNLIIFGELYGTTIPNPTLELNGAGGEVDATVSASGIGPGIAYYVQPINLYFSGTLLLESMSLEVKDSNRKYGTDTGVGGMFSVGKEWWVSDNWGLGVSAQFHMASIKEKDVDYRWTVTSFAVACSATFN